MPLAVDQLALRFEDNGQGHDDLVLYVGQETWRCDSYYLCLDQGLMPGKEDASKIAAVLESLLDQWRQAIELTPDGGACFLPYDLWDEYTGWLRCDVRGPDLLVQRGWAEIEGWKIMPSKVGDLLHGVPGFRNDGPVYVISRESLLHSLGGRRETR